MIHISAPVHSPADYVFVEDRKLEPRCIPAENFRRLGRAMGATLIKCSYCKEPASQLDPHHPYNSSLTMCSAHAKAPRGGWRQVGRLGYWHWFSGYRSLCGNWERDQLTFGDAQVPLGLLCRVCVRQRAKKTTEAS